MKGIILGNNISGLIWGFYHPDWEVIAPVQGIPSHNQYTNSNMVWLHDSFETRKLCKDLGFIDIKPRRALIGYWENGMITETLTDNLSQVLIAKKMTEWSEPVYRKSNESIKLSMTSKDSVPFMNVLGIDTGDLLKALQKRVKVTHGYALAVNTEKDLVGISNISDPDKGCIWVKYDKLISTIPAPAFWKMWCGDGKTRGFERFGGLSITNIIVKNRPPYYDDRYEMIYYNEDFAWTRASCLNGKYGLEFTGIITEEQFKEIYPDIDIMDYFVNLGGRLIPRPQGNLSPSSKVIFSGRFAAWDHNLTTEFIVRQALDN